MIKYGFWSELFGFLHIPTTYPVTNTLDKKDSNNIFSEKVPSDKLASSKNYYVRIWGYDKDNKLVLNEFDVGEFKIPN